METTSNNSQQVIAEAIRKIALGRSMERISMSPSGTSGIGTARMIHGYVAKVHDNPGDSEYKEYAGTIEGQLKKLGVSCDWDRERFTMDEGCNKAVTEVFVKMHEKGYIYKGARIVNWCPVCNTSISDAEVEYQEQAGHFWHIKYPLMNEDGTPSTTEFLTFATTRPETMLGDTAVAIHPDDERYTHLHGRKVLLPIVNRVIPIVEDAYVDREFGTGVVKITPAHDPNDFEVGKRHDLPVINILNDDATINKNGGRFEGMDRYEARKAIVEELDQMGLLVKLSLIHI